MKLFDDLDCAKEEDYSSIENEFDFYFLENKITSPECVNAFLVLHELIGVSFRSGVWTFYEYMCYPEKINNLNNAISYLEKFNNGVLINYMKDNIHEYDNPKYKETFNYPDEWIKQSEEFDMWLKNNEKEVYKILFDLLCEYKEYYLKNNK